MQVTGLLSQKKREMEKCALNDLLSYRRSLKQECVWINQFENFAQAKPIIDAWVQEYNSQRPHQTLGYLSPNEFFERQTLQKIG
jgi:transposase InsO family protein